MNGARTNTVVVRTPEGIVFPLLPAGPVTRSLAWSLDFAAAAIAAGIAGKILLVFAVVNSDVAAAAYVFSYFVVSIGYGILLEWRFRGQTLGKRLLRLRVIDAEGLSLSLSQVVIRNLLRFVDMLPAFYLVGGVACLVSRRSQRLGDIAGNTMVVRVPGVFEPDLDQAVAGKYNSFRDHPHLAARLRQKSSPRGAYVALEALLRREELAPDARVALFREIAGRFRSLVEFPPAATLGLTDEQYVRNVVDVLFHSRG